MVSSTDPCSGRVEVHQGDEWATVCSKDWTATMSETVCQLLECGHFVSSPGVDHFSEGSGLIVQASDSCFGNVTSLQQCSAKGFSRATCGHDEDVGITCAGKAGFSALPRAVSQLHSVFTW